MLFKTKVHNKCLQDPISIILLKVSSNQKKQIHFKDLVLEKHSDLISHFISQKLVSLMTMADKLNGLETTGKVKLSLMNFGSIQHGKVILRIEKLCRV